MPYAQFDTRVGLSQYQEFGIILQHQQPIDVFDIYQ